MDGEYTEVKKKTGRRVEGGDGGGGADAGFFEHIGSKKIKRVI